MSNHLLHNLNVIFTKELTLGKSLVNVKITSDKSSSQASNLLTQERIYSGEKHYKFQDCDKLFKLAQYLVYHQPTQTGEKPYKLQHDHVKIHQRTHKKKHKLILKKNHIIT